MNLYGMVGNNAVNQWDYLGLQQVGGDKVGWPPKPGPNATPGEVSKWNAEVNRILNQTLVEVINKTSKCASAKQGAPIKPAGHSRQVKNKGYPR
jgi:hypothetical protein